MLCLSADSPHNTFIRTSTALVESCSTWLSIDVSSGSVHMERTELLNPIISSSSGTLMEWECAYLTAPAASESSEVTTASNSIPLL